MPGKIVSCRPLTLVGERVVSRRPNY